MSNLLDCFDINLDNPTPEETELHQELAREIEILNRWENEYSQRENSEDEKSVKYHTDRIDYARAERISRNFSIDEKYMRNLVANITSNGAYADSLDYRGLKREANKIKGIVRKMLKSKSVEKTVLSPDTPILKKISKLKQSTFGFY